MSDINWDYNAKVAVREFYRWANLKHRAGCSADTDKFFSELDVNRPTQTKTVADAVEYYNGEFPEGEAILGIAYSNNKIVPYYAGSPIADGTNSPESYIICTCAEFEAYVKEQEGEKWTHTDNHDNECKILHKIGDTCWVTYKTPGYYDDLLLTDDLKPIKPKLTKAEAWDKLGETDIMENLGDKFVEISRKYDITD